MAIFMPILFEFANFSSQLEILSLFIVFLSRITAVGRSCRFEIPVKTCLINQETAAFQTQRNAATGNSQQQLANGCNTCKDRKLSPVRGKSVLLFFRIPGNFSLVTYDILRLLDNFSSEKQSQVIDIIQYIIILYIQHV